MALDKAIADALRATSTATLTTVLLKHGVRRSWMRGPMPAFNAGERIVGPAFTLRFVPAREDLATPESWSSPRSTRAAIEEMPEGVVAVVDAMGVATAGIFGDILSARMKKRGASPAFWLCTATMSWRPRSAGSSSTVHSPSHARRARS